MIDKSGSSFQTTNDSFLKIFGFNYRFDKVWLSVSTVKYDALEMSKNVFNFTRAPEPHYARFSRFS
jgi:hypothetical protein